MLQYRIDRAVNIFLTEGMAMKREEKNRQTRRKIMDSALMEFAQRGYGGSSVNNICAAQGVWKLSFVAIAEHKAPQK